MYWVSVKIACTEYWLCRSSSINHSTNRKMCVRVTINLSRIFFFFCSPCPFDIVNLNFPIKSPIGGSILSADWLWIRVGKEIITDSVIITRYRIMRKTLGALNSIYNKLIRDSLDLLNFVRCKWQIKILRILQPI